MPSKRIRDVLDCVRRFHRELHTFYKNLSDEARDERIKWLLDYMGRHEQRLGRAVGRYETEAADSVLNTWVQFAPCKTLHGLLEGSGITSDMPVDEVIERALALDQTLIGLYRELADSTSAPHVRDLFSDLLHMEEEKDHRYAKAILDR